LNRSLLQFLIQNYIKSTTEGEKPFVSSHWSECFHFLDIRTDLDGNIVSLSTKNAGLDTLDRHSFLDFFLDWASIFLHWLCLPNKIKILKLSIKTFPVCKAMKRPFNFDVFRQLYCMEIIQRKIDVYSKGQRLSVLMIGDGYGVLSGLFKIVYPESSLVLVDLGKILLLQAYGCQLAHPQMVHQLFNEVERIEDTDFIYCPAEFLESLSEFRFDIAVNVLSMHEMNLYSIKRYFDFLRQSMNENNLFYCCNREFKNLKGGEKTRLSIYPWENSDQILLDELCPWYQFFLSHHGWGSAAHFVGIKIPCVNHFFNENIGFGKVYHRMVRMTVRKG